MDFLVEFYETAAGACFVREFLDELKAGRLLKESICCVASRSAGELTIPGCTFGAVQILGRRKSSRTTKYAPVSFYLRPCDPPPRTQMPEVPEGGIWLLFEQPASFTGFLNARVLWFFVKDRRIVAVHGIRNKGQAIPARDIQTARERMRDWRTRTEP